MKTCGCLFLFLFISIQTLYSQQFGTFNSGVVSERSSGESEARKSAIDGYGNVYTIGNYSGNVFEDTTLSKSFRLFGGTEMFISKRNSNGDLLWVRTFGSVLNEDFFAINVDSVGNVFYSVEATYHYDADPGPQKYVFERETAFEVFSCLDSSGNLKWAHQMNGYVRILDIQTFKDGTVYFSGTRNSGLTLDMDPTSGIQMMPATNSSAVVFCFKESGAYKWGVQETKEGSGHSIVLSTNKEFYWLCNQKQQLGNGLDSFWIRINKVDSLGSILFTQTIPGRTGSPFGVSQLRSLNLNKDDQGGFYLVGTAKNVFYDVDFSSNNVQPSFNADHFFVKYDSSFNLKWVRQWPSHLEIRDLEIDQNHLFLSGVFNLINGVDSIDWDCGPNQVIEYININETKTFLLELDTAGQYVDHHTLLHSGYYYLYDIEFTPNHELVLSSVVESFTLDVDWSSNVYYPNASFQNFFVAGRFALTNKQDKLGNLIWAKNFLHGGMSKLFSFTPLTAGPNDVLNSFGTFKRPIDVIPGDSIALISTINNNQEKLFWMQIQPNVSSVKEFPIFADVNDSKVLAHAINAQGGASFSILGIDSIQIGPKIIHSNNSMSLNIIALDSNGLYRWHKILDTFFYSHIWYDFLSVKMKYDALGNLYVICNASKIDMNPDTLGINMISFSGNGTIVFKLRENGDLVWVKSLGSDPMYGGYLSAHDIEIDAIGDVYIGGEFEGYIDFDPGIGVASQSTVNWLKSGFICNLDSSGQFQWVKTLGNSTGDCKIRDLCIDESVNRIFAVGYNKGNTDFDPGASVVSLTANYTNEFNFIWSIDTLGNFINAKGFPTVSFNNDFNVIERTKPNELVISGFLSAPTDLDPSGGVVTMPNTNTQSCFILQMDTNLVYVNSTSFKKSGPYTRSASLGMRSNGTYYYSGVLLDYLDSNPMGGNEMISTYSPNTRGHFLTDFSLCNSSFSTVVDTSCSIYYYNGTAYTSSGVYTSNLLNSLGCDSVITLDLTITNSLNTGVTQNNGTFYSNQNNANYQWVECPGYNLILGANNQTFTPATSGDYAVILNQGWCQDTSQCYTLFPYLLEETSNTSAYLVYPNPSYGLFYVKSKMNSDSKIEILSQQGSLIHEQELDSEIESLDISFLNSGIYFLRISCDGRVWVNKLAIIH
ncbi:MAG: T9SS type A sorting domain-containing protein [Chitinophagaceae bacterium]|nr:T9SS type A sorting domain-containing protein [Chitinophagaceae bacterium]